MPELSFPRRLLKRIHPEGIPWPGAAFYNAMAGTGIFQKNYELIANEIKKYCEAGNVLDVGTGPGWLLLKLHKVNPELRLTGLDASLAMIEEARKNIGKAGLSNEIALKEGNVVRLPFADASFDAVVSTGSLHHWKDPITGLNEIYRVLKPSKYALVYDIVSDTPKEVMKSVSFKFGRLKMFMLWLHAYEEPFYSQRQFLSLAQSCLFHEGVLRFVGVFCCLMMRKQ